MKKYILREIKSKRKIKKRLKTNPNEIREIIIYEHQYKMPNGQKISQETINKIQEKIPLKKIPPAYPDAMIFLHTNDILAKCKDDKGRLQYIYYKEEQEKNNFQKYCDLIPSSTKLQSLINHLYRTTKNESSFTKDKTIAVLLLMMLHCHFRIGNDKFEKEYGSYGLTTLHRSHIKERDGGLFISFIGKKGVENECFIDKRNSILVDNLRSYIRKSRSIGSEYVFNYESKTGEMKKISSKNVNNFLSNKIGLRSKDLRTYFANILFLQEVKKDDLNNLSQTELKKYVKDKIEKTANKLHHTVSICKNSYLFPPIIEDIENGGKYFKKFKGNEIDVFAQYLKYFCK